MAKNYDGWIIGGLAILIGFLILSQKGKAQIKEDVQGTADSVITVDPNGRTPIGTIVCFIPYNKSGVIKGWNTAMQAPGANRYSVYIAEWDNYLSLLPSDLKLGTC